LDSLAKVYNHHSSQIVVKNDGDCKLFQEDINSLAAYELRLQPRDGHFSSILLLTAFFTAPAG